MRRLGEVSHLLLDAGLIVLATASNLDDDELRLLQEVTDRNMLVIVNVGKNDFRDDMVDLNLDGDLDIIVGEHNMANPGSVLESWAALPNPRFRCRCSST